MPNPERNTTVQISLRSLLGITFGIAVVMAVTKPYLNDLSVSEKRDLLLTLLFFGSSMLITAIAIAWKNYHASRSAGRVILSLSFKDEKKKPWLRWLWLLFFLPATIHFCSYLYSPANAIRSGGSLNWLFVVLVPIMYGMGAAQQSLWLWTERGVTTCTFCEKGIIYISNFYA